MPVISTPDIMAQWPMGHFGGLRLILRDPPPPPAVASTGCERPFFLCSVLPAMASALPSTGRGFTCTHPQFANLRGPFTTYIYDMGQVVGSESQ